MKPTFSSVAAAVLAVLTVPASFGAPPAAPPAAEATSPEAAEPAAGGCVEDPESARRAIETLFQRLGEAYAIDLPGPAGEALRKKRAQQVARAVVDVDGFAQGVLGEAWAEADDATRDRWRQSLRVLLEHRYIERLQDPRHHRLEVGRAALSCDRASVVATLIHVKDRSDKALAFRLIHRDTGWAAWDVSVDGVSLAATYRSRFARIYRDGGASELDRYLADTARRYGLDLGERPEGEAASP
ncbi:MAG: ABC transporter substrate-binding protein [Deltaproteobacteria bacterium]|nr:ABC transporter substrate-binding protein [Deltaproteobacteria bacterium]MCB9788361.1 ABC transporter substrate-binding protein [Deltaproteobacteria bacterium]